MIETLNNVQQRGFAFVYFRLALLARDKRQLDQALAKTEAGLRLEPQNTWGQILLGELFNERGDRARAVSHFKEVAASSFPTNEERAVLAIKLDRLTTGKVGGSVKLPDVRSARVHEALSIALVPLQSRDLPKDIVLADVSVALEVAWRIHCEFYEKRATAFPIDFREFQQKRPRLCGCDEQQRDAFLRARGGAGKVFSDAQRREIDRVFRAYYPQ